MKHQKLETAIVELMKARSLTYNPAHPDYRGDKEDEINADFIVQMNIDNAMQLNFGWEEDCQEAVDEWIDTTLEYEPDYFIKGDRCENF